MIIVSQDIRHIVNFDNVQCINLEGGHLIATIRK